MASFTTFHYAPGGAWPSETLERLTVHVRSRSNSQVALCAEWRLRAGLKTFDQNEVKDFYEMEDWKQCELLIELIELIGSNDVRSLEELSKKEGKTPQEIWANICKVRGFELCTIPERVLTAGRPG
jgi:hypothetical protein